MLKEYYNNRHQEEHPFRKREEEQNKFPAHALRPKRRHKHKSTAFVKVLPQAYHLATNIPDLHPEGKNAHLLPSVQVIKRFSESNSSNDMQEGTQHFLGSPLHGVDGTNNLKVRRTFAKGFIAKEEVLTPKVYSRWGK
jgi:hypothetical protein